MNLITSYFSTGVYLDNFLTAIIVAVVLGCLNTIVKPLLILLSLPMVVFTFGLFLIVINTLLILLTDSLIDGFAVQGFWHALFFSVVLSIVTSILNSIKARDEASE
jgi:putative membrane protein